ncbi:MAG: YqgE/AlgH family protein [Saprospiraceae bacterium]
MTKGLQPRGCNAYYSPAPMMQPAIVQIGKVLVAEPFMMDPNFKRSAVLLCDHVDTEGSIGFILNKPLDTSIQELFDDFPDFETPVFFGGPVQMDTIHYLHAKGDLLENSLEVAPGVFWGGDFEKLKFLIRSALITPHEIRFFIGYSGWSEGQLMEEMNFGSWLLADMDANYLFKTKPEQLWQSILQHKGRNFSVIAQMPEDFSWN